MKKIYALLLFIALATATLMAAVAYLGDLNHDGAVDGSDVSILLEQVLGGGASLESDINGDGSVDGSDVSALLETVLGGDPKVRYEYETYTANGVEFNMVKVPAGSFIMGATEEQGSDAYDSEKPTHQVTLREYMIGQTEVTQELWEAVMGSNPSFFSGSDLPVEQVSWDDCQEFIAKLNELTGKNFRLPTEAEWEYAARGAKSGGPKYAGSDDIDAVAWYNDNSESTTHPVASKQPNSIGLYDMSGNVNEWCQDWYGSYDESAQFNPHGPVSGSQRILRGGSWRDIKRYNRVSYRSGASPSSGHRRRGLRLALDNRVSFTVRGVTFLMVKVPAGSFMMGATSEQGSDAFDYEKPTHQVTLSEYMIGPTEVTQALWEAVMGSNPSEFVGENLPVDNVSWDDCQEFIAKLNELTGKNFRLPTEAEWEYAARGGQSAGTKYAGSNDIDAVAWYNENSEATTHPVASKQPNSLGLYDMSGNVNEWCQDWYGSYDESAQINPQGPESGSQRVLRGGNWALIPRFNRVSDRGCALPSSGTNRRGLRLALDNKVTYTVNGVSFKMVSVPAGTFTMGGTAEQGSYASSDEKPVHEVSLSDYQIGETEVTQELWEAVMGSNPSYWQDMENNEKRPVENVRWNDCQKFIVKLNELTGENFRLPTEAEWEYAARGAKGGGTMYAGSDNANAVAWYISNSVATTHPVGSKLPNALGIYDMSGNVWEWCSDWYGEYSPEAQINPQGPSSGDLRVMRGGCYGNNDVVCRVSTRGYSAGRTNNIGLRIAR